MKTSINLPENFKKRLVKAAEETSNSQSSIIRMALRDYLKRKDLWKSSEVTYNVDR